MKILRQDSFTLLNHFIILEPEWIICLLETGRIPPYDRYIHKAHEELINKEKELKVEIGNSNHLQEDKVSKQ